MKISELEKLKNEGVDSITSEERRHFLKFGLAITGVFMGGSVLSLTSAPDAQAFGSPVPAPGKYPYNPHYTMVIREHLCVDCEKCKDACVKTNDVPAYGFRTTILEKERIIHGGKKETVFMPVLCNHCNRPPCVRVCPTTATFKDPETGIVVMNYDRCIGCKTCMAACPYNARYFKEENRAIDKCNFCLDTRLSKGEKDTACAAACPANVRIFGNLSDTHSDVYKYLHKRNTKIWVLRPETGALPNIFYVNS